MAKFDVVNLKNEKVGSVDLPEEVFGVKVNQPLVLQVIKAQLAGLRQGTASTKTKGLIRGGGKKPFKQKGTGNARQGSSRSPLNPGGGSNFGPQPRKYNQRTPKEMVRGALRCVLSDKALAQHLVIVDRFDLSSGKTKDLASTLKKSFKIESALLIDAQNQKLSLASRNLPRVNYVKTEGTNTYDIVKHEWLIISKESAQALAARLA
ncbi:MAG TPA: 50S ribosomal protein L4 [Oligoflexia bacterium]|nr:50S ribosomal protein L4 [Oligoflexia bacterium]